MKSVKSVRESMLHEIVFSIQLFFRNYKAQQRILQFLSVALLISSKKQTGCNKKKHIARRNYGFSAQSLQTHTRKNNIEFLSFQFLI